MQYVKPIFFSIEDLMYAWDKSTQGKCGDTPQDVKVRESLVILAIARLGVAAKFSWW
jgi:hypothetical protein